MAKKEPTPTLTESEAKAFTGYGRTRLYQFRRQGLIRWTAALSGRKIRYNKEDLERLIGIN